MTRYTKAKAEAHKIMLAGIGGGFLLFILGSLVKVPPLSSLGLLASIGSGGVGCAMREKAKSLRNNDEIYEYKRKELEKHLENAKQRASQMYRLDYFDIDRNQPDFITFNAYEMVLSDRVTKAKQFNFVEKEKIYQTRTRREVERVTKKRTYYREWQKTYVDKVVFAITYNNSSINARVGAARFDGLIKEYNQLNTRLNSIANLEREYKQLLHQKNPKLSRSLKVQPVVQQNVASPNRRDVSQIEQGYQLANKYKVVQKLGEGGFGATFIVESLTANLATQFVAKCQKITGDVQRDRELIDRFEREAVALQRVGNSHGQVPSVFDYFDFEGNFYLIQEFVRGQTLMKAFIQLAEKRYVFSEQKAAEIIASLLEILERIHEQGIIHRDIKPENIILREGDGKPVLIDFGLIKQLTQDNLQETGTSAGTIGYCPIEQQLGKAFFQSDLYAVGMVMLLLTTGRPPHTLKFNDQLEPDLEWAKSAISSSLFDWVAKATRPLPQERFASAQEMREALLAFLNQEYFIRGAQMADEVYQQQIVSMEAEIQNLQRQLNQPDILERPPGKVVAIPSEIQANPKCKKPLPNNLSQIITTQKELDAYNTVKRILQKAGYDPELIQLTDSANHCDIHLRDRQDLVLIRLYFNDENDLAFGLLQTQSEERYHINTLRGLPSHKQSIIQHLEVLFAKTNLPGQRTIDSHPSSTSEKSQIDEILRREILPFVLTSIEESFGSNFEIISLNIDEESSRIYGQFAGLENQSGWIFNYEIYKDSKGNWGLKYGPSEETRQAKQKAEQVQIDEENRLADQGVYTPEWLQRNFSSFKSAKEHFGVTARSWGKLAEKLNEKSSTLA